MNAPKWKHARMDILAGLAVAALGSAFYMLGVKPVVDLKGQQTVLESFLQQQRSAAGEALTKVHEKETKLSQTQNALKSNPVHLQPSGTVNARINKLTDLATKFDLKVDEIQPAEPTYGADYGTIPIHLAGRGTYRTWTAFLHEMTELLPDTSVQSFELSSKPGDAAAEFHVSLRWYVLPMPSVAAK